VGTCITPVAEFCALKLLIEVDHCHLRVDLVNGFDGIPHLHGGSVSLDAIEDLVRDHADNELDSLIFFKCPSLVGC
jgi:hypothetical protein